MKDIIFPKSEVESYALIQNLWSNDFFRKSPYVQRWAMKAAKRRPLLFTMTHPDIEWSHFTSYLCCLALRQYDNSAIQDLYYLHELIHIAEMPHLPEIDFYNWRTGVFRNELTASMNSEIYAYFEMPELRERTFDHEIWADRFLIPRWKGFYETNKGSAQERLRRQRKLVSTNPNPNDYVEQQIAGYFHQNIQWAEIWREIYADLGPHMHSYVTGGIEPTEHKEWIEDHVSDGLSFNCIDYGKEGWSAPIPFLKQAMEFSQQYHKNRRIFGNQKLEKQDNG